MNLEQSLAHMIKGNIGSVIEPLKELDKSNEAAIATVERAQEELQKLLDWVEDYS